MGRYGYDDDPDFSTPSVADDCEDAHEAFCEGVQDVEGIITDSDPDGGVFEHEPDMGGVLSPDIDYNPRRRRYSY